MNLTNIFEIFDFQYEINSNKTSFARKNSIHLEIFSKIFKKIPQSFKNFREKKINFSFHRIFRRERFCWISISSRNICYFRKKKRKLNTLKTVSKSFMRPSIEKIMEQLIVIEKFAIALSSKKKTVIFYQFYRICLLNYSVIRKWLVVIFGDKVLSFGVNNISHSQILSSAIVYYQKVMKHLNETKLSRVGAAV